MAIHRLSKLDEFGYPISYRSASAAGCSPSQIPVNGLVFYASLSNNSNVAETGQELSMYGDVQYTRNGSIPCAYFDGDSYLYYSYGDGEFPKGTQPSTLSIWVKVENLDDARSVFGYGQDGVDNHNQRKLVLETDEKLHISNNSGGDINTADIGDYTDWHHYCATISESGSVVSLYVDGVAKATGSFTLRTDAEGNLCIGVDPWDLDYGKVYGYLAAVRLYNRVLTDKEIQKLSREFDV